MVYFNVIVIFDNFSGVNIVNNVIYINSLVHKN